MNGKTAQQIKDEEIAQGCCGAFVVIFAMAILALVIVLVVKLATS